MWNDLKNFYNSNKYAILWTVGYTIGAWAIMRYLFNFNIFSALRWHQLFHAHLHGFAGFVFGILILAMVPLYIATTAIIARTHAPLFNFKITIPSFIKTFLTNAFIQTPMVEETPEPTPVPEPQPAPEPEPQPTPETSDAPTTPTAPVATSLDAVPAEMRIAYMRARDNISRAPASAFDLGNVTKAATPVIAPADATPLSTDDTMPIPTDFDISDTDTIIGDTPIFKDIDFDDDTDDDEKANESESPIGANIKTTDNTTGPVTTYLAKNSIAFNITDDVVVTDKFAIASHIDSDFWVADNESWFAAGKIRKSPVASVVEIAQQYGVQPVLYMASDNIMDIDELRPQWESAGIRVINNLDELK